MDLEQYIQASELLAEIRGAIRTIRNIIVLCLAYALFFTKVQIAQTGLAFIAALMVYLAVMIVLNVLDSSLTTIIVILRNRKKRGDGRYD